MTDKTNPALQRDALYSKSQVYIQRGLRANAESDSEEYQLWASLALELLGKAALAAVHPALIADPLHSASLFAACGRQLSPDIKTITAKTLFERLGHIDKAFDSRHQRFCEQMAIRRNAELHSGESPFSGMSADTWEKEFWGAAATVLSMQGETLESWLGAEGSKAPAKLLSQAADARGWAVKNRVMRCREDFHAKFKDPRKRASIVEETQNFRYWEPPSPFLSSYDGFERHECPACGSSGVIGGGLWSEDVSELQDTNDPSVELIDLLYTAEEYVCPGCDLHLFGTKELVVAGLPNEFTKEEVREREFEPDYGND